MAIFYVKCFSMSPFENPLNLKTFFLEMRKKLKKIKKMPKETKIGFRDCCGESLNIVIEIHLERF